MNRAIWAGLDDLNDRPMQNRGVNRRALFEAQERAALQPLPPRPWEWSVWLNTRKVGAGLPYPCERPTWTVAEGSFGSASADPTGNQDYRDRLRQRAAPPHG